MVAIDPALSTDAAPERGPDDTPGQADEAAHVEEVPPSESSHTTGACPVTWCPICVAVGAVQPLAPDVIEHLLKAGTELFMAFRAIVDARADEASGAGDAPDRPTTLEKIDLG